MKKLPKDVEESLNKFINETKNILKNRLKKIILYGSYARGDYNKDSDIDIMILTDLTDKEMYSYSLKIWECAYNIEYDSNFEIKLSPVIKNIDKFNYLLNGLPFYMNVQKEGVVLSES